MKKALRVPDVRRAEFRAMARKLVEHAALRRKHKLTDDFAGRIATALRRVYLQGAHDAEDLRDRRFPAHDEIGTFDVDLLSRQSCLSFADAAVLVFGGPYHGPLCAEPKGYFHRVTANPGKASDARWAIASFLDDGTDILKGRLRLLSTRDVGPWRKHLLVEESDDGHHLIFTRLAFASWCAYLEKHPEYLAWRRDPDTSGYIAPSASSS